MHLKKSSFCKDINSGVDDLSISGCNMISVPLIVTVAAHSQRCKTGSLLVLASHYVKTFFSSSTETHCLKENTSSSVTQGNGGT